MDADRIVASAAAGWASGTPSGPCEDFVKAWEGCVLTPYQDGAGFWTVGYGHKMQDSDPRVTITPDEAASLFVIDVDMTADGVRRLIDAPLRQWQFDALVSFSFNLGCGSLAMSTLRQLVNAGRYDQAAIQFQRWDLVAGVASAGVTKRRLAEAAMFANADYSGRP